ncbi:tetratricopeptide repeat protein [Neobacillus sp. NPDC058068]
MITVRYLAWAAQERGDLDQAIEYVTNAVRLDPNDQQIRQEYLSIQEHS